MGFFRGKDGSLNFTSLGPTALSYSAGASSPDSGAPSLDQGFYNDLINALAMGDTSQAAFEQAAEADLGSVLQQLQTGPVQPTSTSTTGSSASTVLTPQQEESLFNKILDASVEGAADLGNIIFQGVTLGKGPQLEAVVPNIADIIRGRLGGTLVLGGGQTPQTAIGTGRTGVGRGTRVALPPVIGGIVQILKQGGGLGQVVRQFPDILIDNLPTVISAAAAAGYAFDGNDKDTLVKLGYEPSILDKDDGSDDPKIGDPNGDSNNTVDSGGDPDTLEVLTDSQPKFTPVDIVTGSVDSDTPTIRAGGRDIVGSSVDSDTPTIRAGGRDIVGNTLSDDEIDRILAGGMPAVAGGYDDPSTTPSIKTGAAPAAGGGDGGGGGGGGGTTAPSSGIRTVSGGPGPSVDIDYLYDFARGLEQPFQATEEEEEDIVRAAEGGMIGGTDDFERILRILRGG